MLLKLKYSDFEDTNSQQDTNLPQQSKRLVNSVDGLARTSAG